MSATNVGDFLIEGEVQPSQVEAHLSTGKYKSWLCLNSVADGETKCPKARVEAAGIPFDSIPMGPPNWADKEGAEKILAKVAAMEKPAVIQCSTATRASAVLVAHLARKQNCDLAGAMSLAEALNLKIASGPPPAKAWVAMCLEEQDECIFHQLFDTSGSSTYTYLLADKSTKEAVLIDPVLEMVERDLNMVDKLGLKLVYCLNTHCHADHITGSGAIKKLRPEVKSVIAGASEAKADVHVAPGDTVTFGKGLTLGVRAVPGHTAGCVAYVAPQVMGGAVFTGDALLIGGCGRTDFQGGSAETLYDSVHSQIFSLPDHYKVYPAHDYKGVMSSTVGVEKATNPRLTKSKEEFVSIMANLNLPYPKKIDAAVPANLLCGITD